LLIDNLCVDEEEASLPVLTTCLHQCSLGIISPVLHTVAFDDFDLEQFVVCDKCGKP
jgi:hypothetical protein